jgi:hypothetical protein
MRTRLSVDLSAGRTLKLTAVTAAALALGLAVATGANASAVTSRNLNGGGISSVCLWSFGRGQDVQVYYGKPTAPPPPAPQSGNEGHTAPPAPYYEPSAYYDDGYGGYPWAYRTGSFGAGRRRFDRLHGFHNVIHGGPRVGSFHGHSGGRR